MGSSPGAFGLSPGLPTAPQHRGAERRDQRMRPSRELGELGSGVGFSGPFWFMHNLLKIQNEL